MYSLNDAAVVAEHKRIDGILEGLQVQMQVLREKKNGLIPVASLFPEILLYIFELVIAASPHGKGDRQRISLTHVYQHWRAVALNSPSFWRTIPVTRGPCTAEMRKAFIARSGKASLDIIVDENYRMKDMEDFVRDMRNFGIVRRITSLRLNAKLHQTRLLQMLDKMKSSFQLDHLELNRGWFPPEPSPQTKKKSTFVSGLSSLRMLKVVVGSHYSEPYPPPLTEWSLPSSLQRLELCNQNGGPDISTLKTRTPWPQLVRALEPLKDLRSLQLENFIADGAEANLGKFCIPRLQRLSIADTAETITPFLNGLVLPALECIHLRVSLQTPPGTGVDIHASDAFDSILSLLRSALLPPPRAICLELQDGYSPGTYHLQSIFQLRALHGYPHQQFDTELAFELRMLDLAPSNLQLEINVPKLARNENAAGWDTRLCNANVNFFARDLSMLTDSVQLLVLRYYVADLVPVPTILSMTQLRCIVFTTAKYLHKPRSTLPLFEDLLDGGQHSDGHPLPQLRALRFEGIEFAAKHLRSLLAALKARTSAGLHQLRVMFVECEFHAEEGGGKRITVDVVRDQLRPFAEVEVGQMRREKNY